MAPALMPSYNRAWWSTLALYCTPVVFSTESPLGHLCRSRCRFNATVSFAFDSSQLYRASLCQLWKKNSHAQIFDQFTNESIKPLWSSLQIIYKRCAQISHPIIHVHGLQMCGSSLQKLEGRFSNDLFCSSNAKHNASLSLVQLDLLYFLVQPITGNMYNTNF